MTPDSAGSIGVPYNPANHTFNLDPDGGNNQMADVSAMMFSSNDPFAYPNQPITTLDNGSFVKQEREFQTEICPQNMYSAAMPPVNNTPYDNLEVQLMGPFPPYLMQGQSHGTDMSNPGVPIDINELDIGASMVNIDDRPGWTSLNRAGNAPDMNMDEIMGEDWKGGWTIDSRYGK